MKKLILFLLLIPFASIGQGNFFMTHTNVTVKPCGSPITFIGGESYPTEILIDIGTGTGIVTFTFDAESRPDYFRVDFEGVNVIDLPFRGSNIYNYGGSSRTAFTSTLTGRTEPLGDYTYPNFVYNPQDGYPLVDSNLSGTRTFTKTTSTRYVTVTVYAPMSFTSWSVNMSCLN